MTNMELALYEESKRKARFGSDEDFAHFLFAANHKLGLKLRIADEYLMRIQIGWHIMESDELSALAADGRKKMEAVK